MSNKDIGKLQTYLLTIVLTTTSCFASTQHTNDIWKITQKHFKINNTKTTRQETRKQIEWHRKHPNSMKEMASNAQHYFPYVLEETIKRKLPSELALIPFIESNYDPFARSEKGAAGIWQLMPDMASANGLIINTNMDERRDIHRSTQVALRHLTELYNKFDHRWDYAIAAYNAGESRVKKAIAQAKNSANDSTWINHLPQQTQKYLPKILAIKSLIDTPHQYQANLPNIAKKRTFAVIETPRPMAFTEIANTCQIESDLLHKLNPQWKGHSTSHERSNQIFVPTSVAFKCKKKLFQTPLFGSEWVYHKITATESLESTAKRYNSTVASIKQYNFLDHPVQRPSHLIIRRNYPHKPQISNNKLFSEKVMAKKPLGPTAVIHRVQPLENINSIAHFHQVQAEQIAYWNQLKYPYNFNTNTHLIIWKHSNKKHHVSHTVLPGDTVYKIAKQYGSSMQKIKDANPAIQINKIRPKQVLLIPQ